LSLIHFSAKMVYSFRNRKIRLRHFLLSQIHNPIKESILIQRYINWIDKHIVAIAYIGVPIVAIATIALNIWLF
ncbi:hypothetical protein ACPV5V_24670, partial [Vibrio campbellii]